MNALRREPFRLLFPVGALLALAAITPWILFSAGVTRAYLGLFHALTMTQGFLIAVAAGFLGTMIPRRTGQPPLSALELLVVVAALASLPLALVTDRLAVAEAAYLVALATLAQFAIRRLRAAPQAVPPSFILIPFALVGGIAGAALLLLSTLGVGGAWAIAAGRGLAEEGVLVPLTMALAPMLTPAIVDDTRAPASASRRQRLFHAAIGAVFVASFALQLDWPQIAVGLRGVCAAIVIVGVAGVVRPGRAPGLHRRVYQVAMLMVPTGLLAAALRPAYRLPLLHLTFVGGLSLLVFAVGAHVTFEHTGRQALGRRRPWPIAVVAALTLAAAFTRASAERFGEHYVQALGVAATLWLAAALTWTLYLGPMLLGRRA